MPKDTQYPQQGSIKNANAEKDVEESALSRFMRLNDGRTPEEIACRQMPGVVANK